MAEVIWSRRALRELGSITAYIAQYRPFAAERLANRLATLTFSLSDNPDRGRLISRGRRELTLIRPYLIRYDVQNDVVRIRSIRHGARHPE